MSQRYHYIEVQPLIGRIAPHRIGMAPLAGYTFGCSLNYLFQDKTTDFYARRYHYPLRGYGLSYDYLGNRDITGHAVSAYTLMHFNFVDRPTWQFGMRISPGLAWLTHKYDAVTNPENIAIGAHLNFHFDVNVNFNVVIDGRYNLRTAFGLLHYSNGSVLKPNLGLNQLYLSLALSERLADTPIAHKKEAVAPHFRQHEFWAMLTGCVADEYSERPNSRGGGFLCSTAATGYNFRYGGMGKVGLSVDMFYNSNLNYDFDTKNDSLICLHNSFANIMRIGLGIGHQLIYKRFELLTFAGVYFYNKVKPNDFLYTRIGGRFYITDFMFIDLTLKAIGFKAQYIESGIGFAIHTKKHVIQ